MCLAFLFSGKTDSSPAPAVLFAFFPPVAVAVIVGFIVTVGSMRGGL